MSIITPGRVWYELTCAEAAPVLPVLRGRQAARVCIIGGGLAGLATALSLAERGVDAILLEAGSPGDGASGRNGGMVSAGFTRGSRSLDGLVGRPVAALLHRWSTDAMALIRDRIDRHGIACGLTPGLLVASFFADDQAAAAEAAALNAHPGMRLEPRTKAWMRANYATRCYRSGLFDPDGFHLDPLALTRGYARAAMALGARLHAASPARRLERQGAGWRLTTAEGEIDAAEVVLCTNAHGDALSPILRRALLPIATYVIVTAPLGERLAQTIRAPYAVYDDRFATGYYRPLADGRLLWGGRIALRETPGQLSALMRRDLAQVYPQLADVDLAAVWSGRMGFARHKMPLLGRLSPGLWANTAYGGHGLNGTTMGGELTAAAIAESDRRIEAFAAFPPQPVFGHLGRLAAQGIYWGWAARDRLRQGRIERALPSRAHPPRT